MEFKASLGKSAISSLVGGVMPVASGGTLLTFDPEAVRDYFAEQYEG